MSHSYEAEFFADIAEIEDRHFWFQARNEIIVAALSWLRATLPQRPQVLEVGCGTGVVLRAVQEVFDDALAVGLDPFPEAMAVARRGRSPLVQADLMDLPFPRVWDLVLACDVLEHIDDDEAAVAALVSSMRGGATLLVTVPARASLWSVVDVGAGHHRRYESATLHRLLSSAGLEVIYLTELMAPLYPVAWLSRRVRRRTSLPVAVAAMEEFAVPSLVNRPAYRLLRRQRDAVAAQRVQRWPGTSILAVARRTEC